MGNLKHNEEILYSANKQLINDIDLIVILYGMFSDANIFMTICSQRRITTLGHKTQYYA